MVIKTFSSKLVRIKLSHPIKHLSMPPLKTLLGMGGEVDSQLSHTSKIVHFTKLDNGLNLTVRAKILTLDD